MKLVNLTMNNFMPYKGMNEIVFPQEEFRNVMVVFGDNMRGKTSLLNALRWVFYGKAMGRHLREIPLHDILNKEAAVEGDFTIEVSVEFIAEGNKYNLRRYATKKAMVAFPTRPEDFEVSIGLQKNGVALPGHQIESEINRFAPEQVSRFFLFDGELLQEYESLLIEGNEQGKRIKEAIEQVLGVPALIHGRDEIGTLLKNFQKQQARDLAHVEGLEKQAEKQNAWQQKQEAFECDLAALKTKQEETKAKRAALDDDLEAVEIVHDKKTRLDAIKKQQADLARRMTEILEDRKLLLRDAWRDLLRPKLSLAKSQLFDKHEKLTDKMTKKAKLDARIDDLKKILSMASCPTCGQPTEESRRAQAGVELAHMEEQSKALNVDSHILSDLNARIREIDKLGRTGSAEKIQALDDEYLRSSVELTRIENIIETIHEEIKGYDTAEIAYKRVFRDSLIKEEARLDQDLEATQKKIDEAKRELAMIARALGSIPAARATRSTALVKASTAIEKLFSDSIERLRQNLRKTVAEKATESFKKLTTQKSYSGLEINDNYGLTIVDEKRERVTVRSAGAEQIVALSLIDGLARTGRAAGPVVMDTPFGRLDLRHRDNILKYLPTTTGQLVLLVHDGEIRRETDLVPVADRIGAGYEIREISPRHSRIEKA
jgi:DNA sulfur modification protein DndD